MRRARSPWAGLFARQIVRDVLVHVAIATLAGLTLFAAIESVEVGNMARSGTAGDHLLLHLAGLPVVYQQIAPFTALIGALTAVAALSRRLELVAMLSAGAKPTAFLKPAAIAGLVLGVVYAAVTEWAVPPARTMRASLSRKLKLPTRNTDVLRRGRMWFKGKDRIYRVQDLEDQDGRVLGGVTMLQIGNGRLTERLDADRLTHDGTSWAAERVVVRRFDRDEGITTTSTPAAALDLFERPEDFVRSIGAPDRLPLARLIESTRARERLGQPSITHRIELYRRVGLPLSILLAVVLGAGLAMSLGRRPELVRALGVGAALGFGLWALDEVSLALASAAALDPFVAAQLGPCLVGAGVVVVWAKAYR